MRAALGEYLAQREVRPFDWATNNCSHFAAGWVRHIGLSEVGPETIRRAAATAPICDLQIEYSLMSRGIEDQILPTVRDLGIAVTAYGILSRGLLSDRWSADRQIPLSDFRSHAPRFTRSNLPANLALVEALAEVAAGIGASVAEVATAWVLSRGQDIVPLVGAKTRQQLATGLSAVALDLDAGQLAAIEAAVPADQVAGTRYARPQMRTLDSER
jgi:aryl-alcohol dehydrogenase-like predicted oxidoreductase